MSSTSSEVLRADKIWLDGKMVKWEEGQIHIMTHALHYGLGVFEGIRAYRTKDGRLAVFRLREHIRRFYDSAHICLLQMPYSEDAMAEACLELLRHQRERFAQGAYLRPIAFMGDGAMGLGAVNPTRMAITAWDCCPVDTSTSGGPEQEAQIAIAAAQPVITIPWSVRRIIEHAFLDAGKCAPWGGRR